MSEESVFLKNLSADLKPFADKSDCCTFIVRLRKENEQLKSQLQQKENIIKEVREYIIEYFRADIDCPNYMKIYINDYYKLLEILDKENEDIEFDVLKALNTNLDDDVEMG